MDSHDLENALRLIAARPRPELSHAFEQNVWREIRHRKAAPEHLSLLPLSQRWVDLLFRPAWAFASVAVVAASISIVMVRADDSAFTAATHSSLGLGVFSAEAPILPSTLMQHSR